MATNPTATSHGVQCFKTLASAAMDSRLSRGDLGCLAVILDRFNLQEGAAWPSINRLAKEANLAARNVSNSIKKLSDLGYVEVEHGSVNKSNRYKPTFKATDAGIHTTPTSGADADIRDLLTPASSDLLTPASNEHTHRTYLRNIPSKSTRFAEFWQVYPKKSKKKAAEKVWISRNLDPIADQLIAHVRERAATNPGWLKGFIHDPTTFLNGELWNDKWEPAKPQARRPSVTDNFSNKTYQGSTDEELPDCLRSHA